jgi:hypothetical protein
MGTDSPSSRIELTLSVSNLCTGGRAQRRLALERGRTENAPQSGARAGHERHHRSGPRSALDDRGRDSEQSHHWAGAPPGAVSGCNSGYDYAFDLTDLRTLDTELANACLNYLNYDRLYKREILSHLTGGDRALHQWIKDYDVPPRSP